MPKGKVVLLGAPLVGAANAALLMLVHPLTLMLAVTPLAVVGMLAWVVLAVVKLAVTLLAAVMLVRVQVALLPALVQSPPQLVKV